MGFQVKYEEITSIRELILAQLDRWIEQIDAVRSSIVEIAAMSEMHGEAAEHVRSYMWDYHMNLANMIKDTIETYRSSFILYTDWYYNIDSDQMAEMSQDSMEGLEENIQGARSDFDAVAEEVADMDKAVSEAQSADVIIAVMGEDEYRVLRENCLLILMWADFLQPVWKAVLTMRLPECRMSAHR